MCPIVDLCYWNLSRLRSWCKAGENGGKEKVSVRMRLSFLLDYGTRFNCCQKAPSKVDRCHFGPIPLVPSSHEPNQQVRPNRSSIARYKHMESGLYYSHDISNNGSWQKPIEHGLDHSILSIARFRRRMMYSRSNKRRLDLHPAE